MAEFIVVASQNDPIVREAVGIAVGKRPDLGQLMAIIAMHAGRRGLVSKIELTPEDAAKVGNGNDPRFNNAILFPVGELGDIEYAHRVYGPKSYDSDVPPIDTSYLPVFSTYIDG